MSDKVGRKKSVSEMDSTEEKPKYESPTVLTLGELNRGVGQCVPGSTDTTFCSGGSAPPPGQCIDGGADQQ